MCDCLIQPLGCHILYCICTVKNCRSLLEQSSTAYMPLLMKTTTFALGRRCQNSPKWCNLYSVHTTRVKVKFSHTHYQALGPELIPVYGQSARKWLEAIHMVVGCHYIPPGLGHLPSWRASPPISQYKIILLGDRGTCVSSLSKAVTWKQTGQDSNQWPFALRANALPLSHTGHSVLPQDSKKTVFLITCAETPKGVFLLYVSHGTISLSLSYQLVGKYSTV